jgi:hypothetical protein
MKGSGKSVQWQVAPLNMRSARTSDEWNLKGTIKTEDLRKRAFAGLSKKGFENEDVWLSGKMNERVGIAPQYGRRHRGATKTRRCEIHESA